MIPTDSEFLLLYLFYLGFFLHFFTNFIITKRKEFIINLIIFLIYTAFMIYIFCDKENFKYGNSLVVLFYGGMFLLIHFIIYISIALFKSIFNKKHPE